MSDEAIDKQRVLEWFTRNVIDNPNVEVVSMGTGSYCLEKEGEPAVYMPNFADFTLRPAAAWAAAHPTAARIAKRMMK